MRTPASVLYRFWLVVARLVFAALAWHASGLHAAPTDAELQREALAGFEVRPSRTDPAIKTFDSPHYVYVDRRIIISHAAELPADRKQLLLWLPGTNPQPDTNAQGRGGSDQFCQLAATLGYHVISLKYPNNISATLTRLDRDPKAFEDFRMAIIAGTPSRHITIPQPESIEHRLIKLLLNLQEHRPREQWRQFLNDDNTIKWSAIAVAGQSQGGGHAALIAMKHPVARVICTGAPKDYSLATHGPAAWLAAQPATERSRFFTLNHQQDHQGCTPEQQLEILRTMKLDTFGAPMDIDQKSPPYGHSHILTTNFPGTLLDSKTAHTSVMNGRNANRLKPAWIYLLTENAP